MDLMSAGEADRVHTSTGAVESGSNMIVKSVSSSTAVVTKAEWCAAKSHVSGEDIIPPEKLIKE